MVTGCALGIDVCHWMQKVNMVQGQRDSPLTIIPAHKCKIKDAIFRPSHQIKFEKKISTYDVLALLT